MFRADQGDSEGALEDLDFALQIDPDDATLKTAKARWLVFSGRYAEAISLYRQLVAELDGRPRRWRVSTRDQAAEALRRAMEANRTMNDTIALQKNFVEGCEILY